MRVSRVRSNFGKHCKCEDKMRRHVLRERSKNTSNWKGLELIIQLSSRPLKFRCWQRAIFPGGGPPSIFASVGLYDCVRDGNRWFPYDWPPTNFSFADCWLFSAPAYTLKIAQDISSNNNLIRLRKALVRLVSVGWKCCHSYTSDLSTLSSATGLTSLCYERSHLTVGFVLICFQHLSAWNTATGRLPLAG